MSPGLVIGLDVGTKTIGLARYDPRTGMASPWTTLSRRGVKKDVAQLRGALASLERPAAALVVGLPLELDGAEGRSCRLARPLRGPLPPRSGPLAELTPKALAPKQQHKPDGPKGSEGSALACLSLGPRPGAVARRAELWPAARGACGSPFP